MTRDTIDDALDALAPNQDVELDWHEVVSRAGKTPDSASRRALRRRPRKRWLIALAAVVAVVSPLSAVGAAEEWWFFTSLAPPTSTPQVLKSGTWAGASWELVGYKARDGLCFLVMPAGSPRDGSGVSTPTGCGGTPDPPDSTGHGGIGSLSGVTLGLPNYVVGPVVEGAQEVSVHLSSGETIRTPTFDVPESLGAVDFYATDLPAGATVALLTAEAADGRVVACFVLDSDELCSKL